MTDSIQADEALPLRNRGNRRSRKQRGALLFVRDLVVIVVVALLISFLVKTFLVRSFYIPSESMQQTLQVDDRILVNELVPGLVDVKRGDVVVFKDPGGWLSVAPRVEKSPFASAVDGVLTAVGLSASDSNDHLIKRVIGLPGDVVECCNALGQMSVNGVPLDESEYAYLSGYSNASGMSFKVTVPEGKLWVMGDNRYNSEDSRYHQDEPSKGFVPMENVVGRAFVIMWPFDRWSGLSDYPDVFAGVPAPTSSK